MGLDTVPQLSMAPKTHIELRFFETYVMRLFENLLERRAQQYTGGERIKKKGSSVHSIGGQNMEASGQLQQQRSVSGTADIFKFTLKYHDRSTLTSLAMLKKAASHEDVRILQPTEAGLRAHTKGGTLYKGHSLAELKSILAWHMTLSYAETFALLPQTTA